MIIGSFDKHEIGDKIFVDSFPYQIVAESSYQSWIEAGGLEENVIRVGEDNAYFYEVSPWYKVTIKDV